MNCAQYKANFYKARVSIRNRLAGRAFPDNKGYGRDSPSFYHRVKVCRVYNDTNE